MTECNHINAGRRGLLIAGALSATAVAVPGVAGAAEAANTAAQAGFSAPPVLMKVNLDVNGQRHSLELDTRTTLLDALREHLHLTGTKKGCDHGQCGACTVMLDGQRINACLTLAVMHEGASSPPSRDWARPTSCTRCRPPSSRMTAINAATARRGRSARPSPRWEKSARASPATSART